MGKASRRKKRAKNSGLEIDEDVKVAVQVTLQQFLNDESKTQLEFPASLSSVERARVHFLAGQSGLKSKSTGKAPNRILTVYKSDSTIKKTSDASLDLSKKSLDAALVALRAHPVTDEERLELLPFDEKVGRKQDKKDSVSRITGRLNSGLPQVPPAVYEGGKNNRRKKLPIWKSRGEILQCIRSNRVTLITGATGSGKTTQVPQFIMENHASRGEPCRIICTEPRRIAAVSMAERVSRERFEGVGTTTGYQIRLESRISSRTILTYCTNGVLLRSFLDGGALSPVFNTITHVIVDEVHERDCLADFLLAVVKDALGNFPHLKLILMSATIDVKQFKEYFPDCHHVSVPGKTFPVEELFLEDILLETNFITKGIRKKLKRKKNSKGVISNFEALDLNGDDDQDVIVEVDEKSKVMIDKCLVRAFKEGDDQSFNELYHLYFVQDSILVPINYQHSTTGVTALICAAGRANLEATEYLIRSGANPKIKASNGWTALDFAESYGTPEVSAVIKENLTESSSEKDEDDEELKNRLLKAYTDTHDDDAGVNRNFVVHIVKYIAGNCQNDGAILVFLPGYEDIVEIKHLLECDSSNLLTLTMHSQMSQSDQKKIFQSPPPGIRKVILSTNISETSITIDDVVYVIDSGKVKEKNYDGLSDVSLLKETWITQSSAFQRSGRAGRTQPGVCFKMYSRFRGRHFFQQPVPEILRMPLMDLCLVTKLLAAEGSSIEDFLGKVMDTPPSSSIETAVQYLKDIEALDPWEEVTELGSYLLNFPVDPKHAKMLLISVPLKCLDPVLTIVSSASYRTPFTISPAKESNQSRKDFAENSLSDHMALLRVFQEWQAARKKGHVGNFCRTSNVSYSVLEMIEGMREQILRQLRACGFVSCEGPRSMKDLNVNSENWAVIKAALVAGSYPSLARQDGKHGSLQTRFYSKVRLQPRSVACSGPDGLDNLWYIFDEMTKVGRNIQIKEVTAVIPFTTAIFAGPLRLSETAIESDEEELFTKLKVDGWITYSSHEDVISAVFALRQKWSAIFLRFLSTKKISRADEAVIQTIVRILTIEEQSIGLLQPKGIGQKPNKNYRPRRDWGSNINGNWRQA